LRAEKSWGGCQFVFADPVRKSDIYSACDSLGFWRSTDYGLTWVKTNTGMNGNKIIGRTWSGAIDQNPKRDPAALPAIYVTLGYGTSAIWKSTNGGVDWTNVWNNNVFKEDGVTNIFSDVGSDINGLYATDATNADHLICYLHGYFGKGGNSGVFETTDGGGKWIVHGTGYFNFQAHSDVAFPINSSTWEVSHGTTYPNSELWRTTDAGKTWGIIANNFWIGGWNGAQNLRVGSVIYGEGKPLAKSTDEGGTWTRIMNAGPAGTSCLTETGYIYVTPGDQDQGAAAFNLKREQERQRRGVDRCGGPRSQDHVSRRGLRYRQPLVVQNGGNLRWDARHHRLQQYDGWNLALRRAVTRELLLHRELLRSRVGSPLVRLRRTAYRTNRVTSASSISNDPVRRRGAYHAKQPLNRLDLPSSGTRLDPVSDRHASQR
jgi:hypothetical protein